MRGSIMPNFELRITVTDGWNISFDIRADSGEEKTHFDNDPLSYIVDRPVKIRKAGWDEE